MKLAKSVQCTATAKGTGERCRRQALRGATVCVKHGGAAPQVRRVAAQRVADAADDAAANLVRWMGDATVDIRVRTQIAQDLLTRAGVSGKTTVDVHVPKFEQLLGSAGIFVDLPDDDVIAGEVVDDDAPALPAARVPGAQQEEYWDGGVPARTPAPSSARDRRGRVKRSAR